MSRLRSWRTGIWVLAAFLAVGAWATRTGRADTFGAAVEWAWTGPLAGDPAPAHAQVKATPIVVSLNDDDGDGLVDEGDVPDIVFPTTSSLAGTCLGDGVLRAISGADGTPIFSVTLPAHRVNECSPAAAGDIDGDGLPEVVAFQGAGGTAVNRLLAFENDGTFKWFSDPIAPANRPDWAAGPSIADVNHDGQPEIVLGSTVFDNGGRTLFSRPCHGAPGAFSTVVNLDLAGDAEVVCGFAAYRSNGALYFDARPPGARSGVPAVANFDDDDFPEVVVADRGAVSVLEHDGTPKWGPVVFEAGLGSAGAPVVADLDGDGDPEIAVAGRSVLAALDTNGTLMWQAPISGGTSSATGPAGFDFDRDGRTELVHGDEGFLRVFDGTTGAVLFSTPIASCAWAENPVVADVDGDASAEIVLSRNRACYPQSTSQGIFVFGDAAWVDAPGVWNQHAYHVTNVGEDGTIPAEETNNWQVAWLNNFRVNAFPTAPQSPPVASDLSVTTPEDTPAAFTLPATDPDGDPLTFATVSLPLHGTLSGAAPDLTYTPAPDFHGEDSFTFQANDGHASSNVATVTIEVTSFNDAPVAFDQAVTTSEDMAVDLDLVATDVDGDPLTYTIATPPAHGTLSGTAPDLTYTPAADYVGGDSFTFFAEDGFVSSNVATITLTMTPANDPPTASDQSATTSEDAAVDLVLAASDIDGDALTYVIVSPPAHGNLAGSANARTYTPAPNYSGSDSFTFKVSDGVVDSNVATVAIVVTAVNDPPTAQDLSVTTGEDMAAGVALVASDVDGDALTWAIVSPPAHGSLAGSAPALTYTPAAHYFGSDSFTFRVSDGQAFSNVATVSIVVTAANDPPVAVAAVVGGSSVACAGPEGAVVTLSAAASSDPDGDPLTYAWQDEAGGLVGSTVVVEVTVPLGRHTFTLTVSDGRGGSSSASVTVAVGDTKAPKVKLWMSPSVLWPPNHKMVPVVAHIKVSDACDASPKVVLKKVTNSEDDDDCGKPWIEGARFGTDDRRFKLRAERKGKGPGRVYRVTYTVTDASGNKAWASAKVVVPHDRGHDDDDDHDDRHDD